MRGVGLEVGQEVTGDCQRFQVVSSNGIGQDREPTWSFPKA